MDANNGVGFNFREIEDRRLFSTYQKYDLDLSRGLGARVWDTAGREYLDFMAGYGVAIMGHRHPEIVKALKDQLDKLMICHGSVYNEARAKFLDELFRVAPPQMSRVFLSNSGAEAVEVALKLARKYTGKKEFIAFTGAYHGKTLGALSVTHAPKYRGSFAPLLQNVRFASFGDIASLEALDGSDVAAIIVEPVQGEGGVNIPSDDFLPAVEDKARRLGALFIVDEIQ
ncbi:MAG: aspartate aminotransferase family protein [Nitrososphaerota archaeon]|nr:aspartate aminotransferase family protein [Nitrososphaerota archaeon]